MSEERGFGQIFMAFLGGAVAGAAVAYLTAPRSGRETRESIADYYSEGRERAHRLPDAVKNASGAAKKAFDQSIESSGTK